MTFQKRMTPELTRELIMQEARALFIAKGYQHVSMRNIAKELGCSHGALYYHFKNKAELFYEIVEVDFAKLNNRLDETLQEPKDDATKLYNVFLRFIEFGLNNQSQYEIMFIVRNMEVDGLTHGAGIKSYEKFAQAVKALSRKDLKVFDIWSSFLAVHGFVAHYRGFVKGFDEAEEAARAYVQFILKGLLG